jgi:hypothetical protein
MKKYDEKATINVENLTSSSKMPIESSRQL